MKDDTVVFPPPFVVRHMLPGIRPCMEAAAAATRGELGAADVLWAVADDDLALALLLEPVSATPPLAELVEVMQTAVMRALAALLPAQVAVAAAPDGCIMVNAGEMARIRLHHPPACSDGQGATDQEADSDENRRPDAADALPPWLLLCLDLHLRRPRGTEGGHAPEIAVLAEEGGIHLAPEVLVAVVLRHFLLALHAWQDGGRQALIAMRRGC